MAGDKLRKTRGSKPDLPSSKSIKEEAEFYETQDSAEFASEFEEVEDVEYVKTEAKKGITVRLDESTLSILRRKAREKGIGPSTLARMWLLEHLREQEEQFPAQFRPGRSVAELTFGVVSPRKRPEDFRELRRLFEEGQAEEAMDEGRSGGKA